MKYRLKIKYPIEEEHLEIAYKLTNSSYIENDLEIIRDKLYNGNGYYKLDAIPESWLEEIPEDSAFDKWWRKPWENPWGELKPTEKELHLLTWKASQENRDLLYKDLIDFVLSFSELSIRGVRYEHVEDYQKKMAKIIEKIKVALQSN